MSGVEALVSWLLDHPDIHFTELSDADTVSDEYSDEEVLEELEDAEPIFSVVHCFFCFFYLTSIICTLLTKMSLSIFFMHDLLIDSFVLC